MPNNIIQLILSISVDKNSPRINKCIVVKSASSDIGSIKITLAFHRRRKTAYRRSCKIYCVNSQSMVK